MNEQREKLKEAALRNWILEGPLSKLKDRLMRGSLHSRDAFFAGYEAARNEWHKIETVRDLPTPDKTLYLWRMRADEWKGEVRLQSFSEADQPEGFVKVYAAWVHIPVYQED